LNNLIIDELVVKHTLINHTHIYII